MFNIHKISPLLLKINLPQILTIYDILRLRKLSEDFQENILDGVSLVYKHYSEQPVSNDQKKDSTTVILWKNFQNWMAVDSCFWTVQEQDFQENILGEVILVYNSYFEQSVCKLFKRKALLSVFSGESFENG